MAQEKYTKIKHLLDESNKFYLNLLGYTLEQTILQSVQENQWCAFMQRKGLNSSSLGVYLPRNQEAIIRDDNPLSLFHEYFGHGLYCEQSVVGKTLVGLERNLLEEETREFRGRQFTLEDVEEFRVNSGVLRDLNKFKEENLGRYELFAIWTEHLLSNEFGMNESFEKKYDSLDSESKKTIENVVSFGERYGPLATFYESGLARVATSGRVKSLLEGVYGVKNIEDSRLVLLSGNRKPFSEIDLFSSSNCLSSAKNDWLDLVNFDEDDFDERVRLFEVQISYPILMGEFVAGDKGYLMQKRVQLKTQPISEEAIAHNFSRARANREYAKKCVHGSDEWRLSLSYAESYERNGKLLRAGNRDGLVLG